MKLWEMKSEGIIKNMKLVFLGTLLGIVSVIVFGHLHWSQIDWAAYYVQSGLMFVLFDVLAVIFIPTCVAILWGITELAWVLVSPSGSTEGE